MANLAFISDNDIILLYISYYIVRANNSLGRVVGRATATALGCYRVLHLYPLAYLNRVRRAWSFRARQTVVLLKRGRLADGVIPSGPSAVPPQQRHVLVPRDPAVHAGRNRTRRVPAGTVAIEQPPRPKPLAQIFPFLVHRTHGPAPQVLLDFPTQLSGYPGLQPPAVGQREEFRVQLADFLRHLPGRHQSTATVPPATQTNDFVRNVTIQYYI